MAAHVRAPRPYRGGKRRVKPQTEKPTPRPGDPDGPGHYDFATSTVAYVELANLMAEPIDLDKWYESEPRDSKGRWTDSALTNAWVSGGKAFHKIKTGKDPAMSAAFNDMLQRQPSAPTNVLYRGTQSDRYDRLKVGDVLDWTEPSSTTTTLPTAIRFGTRKGRPPTLFRITSGAGRMLPGQERDVTMHEAVVPPGKFRVTGRSSVPVSYPGTRMQHLHPDAPTSVEVVDLEDITQGDRDFRAQLEGRHRAFKTIFDMAKHDVSGELRDRRGRWTDTPDGGLLGDRANARYKARPQAKVTGDIVNEPDDGMDKAEPDPTDYLSLLMAANTGPQPTDAEKVSYDEQTAAQERAENAFQYANNLTGALWRGYQRPDAYGTVNAILRGEKARGLLKDADLSKPDRPVDTDQLKAAAKRMFQEGGTTIRQPMTVYRALRTATPTGVGEKAATHDWATILTPGSTFQEDGIVSTTSFRRLAQGWLGIGGNANGVAEEPDTIDPEDVVMEIHVPAGSRIVGGQRQFIETMLPPGTTFKIRSSQKLRTPNAASPFGQGRIGKPIVYTHVVADAILPEPFGPSGTVSKAVSKTTFDAKRTGARFTTDDGVLWTKTADGLWVADSPPYNLSSTGMAKLRGRFDS